MRYVVYLRVSTQRQGRSGLGLEAQQAAVDAFIGCRGGRIIGTFTEIESGTKASRLKRPQLNAAIEKTKAYGATLLVAKLDRLARDAAFLLSLRDGGIDFIACDMPDANRLTIGILALVAEQEAEAISSRTKAALAARKARSLPLGNSATLTPGTAKIAAIASQIASDKAREHQIRVLPIVRRLIEEGCSLRAVARQLSADGVPTARGGKWTAMQVSRILYSL
jgi:DNA invertase Pin-like site-specific DNA recombinase